MLQCFFTIILGVCICTLAQAQNAEWEPVATPAGANIQYVFEHSSGTVLAYGFMDPSDHPRTTSSGMYHSVFSSSPPFDAWVRNPAQAGLEEIVEIPDGTLFARVHNNILKSADTGKTWRSVLYLSSYRIVSRGLNIVAFGWEDTLAYSSDGGVTWNKSVTNIAGDGLPGNDYAFIDHKMRLYASFNAALLRTDNWTLESVTWSELNSNTTMAFQFPDSTLCAQVYKKGLYRSYDDGQTWELFMPDRGAFAITTGGDIFDFLSVTVPTSIWSNDKRFLLIRLRYGSTTWDSLRWSESVLGNDRVFAGRNVYIASNGKLLRTTDVGDSWEDITADLSLYSYFDIQRLRNNELMINGRSGQFVSEQQGADWNHHSFFSTRTCLGPNSEVYALLDTGLLASYDNGRTYRHLSTPPFLFYMQSIVCTPNGDLFIAIPYRNNERKDTVYVSKDKGVSWQPFLPAPIYYTRVSKSGQLFFLNSRLFRQRPGTTEFDTIPLNTPGHPVFDPILITNSGAFIALPEDSHVILIDSNSTNISIFPYEPRGAAAHRQLLCLAQDANDIIYAGDRLGVYFTKDMGATWTQFDNGIITKYIYDLYYDNSDRRMYATTPDGIYRTIQPVVLSAERATEVAGFSLAQNYPNPFAAGADARSTEIQFSVASGMQATVRIYDHLGREVATVYDGFASEGIHSITFAPHDLPAGVYMYRLQTQQGALTKKMVMVE